MAVKTICGTILIAECPAELAQFYSQVLGVEFQREEHGGLEAHYGADIGSVHFGIHPPSNFKGSSPSRSSVIAFNVTDLSACSRRLSELNAEEVLSPRDEGFGKTTTFRDPAGNLVEIVELNYDFN